ncbi:YqgF family RNAse H domain-containing protein [Bartonella bacilliformis str. Heidi Mejia]|uniref:Holliday junction resolvase RuvX n=1 Tax=Bartonella bacilliformis TaxID=774 RepID=UPI000451B4CA|nr:Holliday junction resolvase RuvX [Bartonella bacilliformis]EYS91934.1 YqgF family RNAse H domain-containing protein [Bartonella bacilliformis str. Heidi Mejia]KEG18994.1 YqgF family RNAse H domain-containing protein [Bartonella bacilliformis Hosp800-02]KEG23505.1 YqgF family RNAse H domain-containing protein [Bartonella bacilliformis VAB9028]KEG24451.1 YqgF family RNAse H domain-containing protein [Bartonella bacilliformis CAR600-02]
MAIITIDRVISHLSSKQTIAGLDLGTKTIGIAISDISLTFSNPRPVIQRKKFTLDALTLIKIFDHENVGVVIIGLPINMDGSNGPRVQATRTFVSNIAMYTKIPFIFWDERLSTIAAQRHLLEMDVSRTKRENRIDSAAAAFILQGALDRIQILRQNHTEG